MSRLFPLVIRRFRAALLVGLCVLPTSVPTNAATLGPPLEIANAPGLIHASTWLRPWGSYTTLLFPANASYPSDSGISALVQVGTLTEPGAASRRFSFPVLAPSAIGPDAHGIRFGDAVYLPGTNGYFISRSGLQFQKARDLWETVHCFATDGSRLYALAEDGLYVRSGTESWWNRLWFTLDTVKSCSQLSVVPATGDIYFTGRVIPFNPGRSRTEEEVPLPNRNTDAIHWQRQLEDFLLTGRLPVPPAPVPPPTPAAESSYLLKRENRRYRLHLLPHRTSVAAASANELYRLTERGTPAVPNNLFERSGDGGTTWTAIVPPAPFQTILGLAHTTAGVVIWGMPFEANRRLIALYNPPAGPWSVQELFSQSLASPVRVFAAGGALIIGDARSITILPLFGTS
jgi:hypothetical protein